jgi:hypothetical protein
MSVIKKRDVFLAKWIKEGYDEDGNQIQLYEKPISLSCTLNSLSGSYDIAVYGDKVKNMCKTLLDYDEWINNIKEKDVVYLYGATPDGELINGSNANYIVESVLPQNLKILVYFKKRI